MAKKIINVGVTANDKSGDPLRTAFQKVNDNFTELYNSLGIDGTVFDPLNIDSNLVPSQDDTFDIGTPTKQWRSMYVGLNTLYINNVPISLDNGGNLTVNGESVSGSVTTGANPPLEPINGQLWWENVDSGRLYIFYNGAWVDASPQASVIIPTDISQFTDNTNLLPGDNYIRDVDITTLSPGDSYFTQTADTVSMGHYAAQNITAGPSGIQIAGTGGVEIMGAATATVRLGGGTSGHIIFNSPTEGINFNDLGNRPGNLSNFNNDLEIDASTLTGTTLASNVTGSSLTSVGQLTGLTSTGVVHITNTEDSVDADTGALQVDGGAHITKNLIAEGTIYAGVDAYSEVLTNPLMVASAPSGVSGGYSQVAILNNTAEASGDFQVMIDGYDVNVSDTGWADLGMAGSNFSDARYTITEPGDGYVFVSGKEGSTNKGSLVLATDESGTVNDIVFATGGFTADKEKMRLLNSDGSLNINSGTITSDNNINLTANGYTFQVGTGGAVDMPGPVSWTNTVRPYQAGINWNEISDYFIVSSPTDFKILTNDGQVPPRLWNFDADGNIHLPAGGDIKDSLGNSVFSSTYTLPTASDTVLGGVKVDGTTVVIVDGVISATGAGGGGYSLPTATTSTLGGVKIDGSTITIASGVISAAIPTNVSTFTNDAGYLTSVTTITGNAGTATALQTPRNINGVAFDGTGNITVTAAAGTLTGNTLNAGVTSSSLTSVGTLTNLTVTNPISGSVTGSAGSVSGANITGTTLASNVVSSSLTSVGTLANLTVTNTITGSVSGNAGTVTNGVYTSGSYADPSWITSLAYSKLTGTPTLATVATSGSYTDLTSKPTLATVATSGSYTDLTDKPTIPDAYTLPTATTSVLGGVKVDGTTISIDGNGVISSVGGTAAAGTLTGTTLNSTVVNSSLTSVGTLTSLTTSGTLTRSGNISSAAWTTAGIGLKIPAATYTDTSSSGAVTYNFINYIGIPTLASTNVTTVSTSAALYIAGDPVAGTNTTVTAGSAYGLFNAGKSYFQGAIKANGGIYSGGGAAMLTFSNTTATVAQSTASTSYTTGSLVVSGGVGIAGAVNTNSNITAAGYVAQTACPAFRVVGSTSTTLTVGTVLTSSYFTLDYQQGGTNLVVSTGIFTVPVTGLYQINLTARAYSNAGIASQIAVVKNPSGSATVMCMIEWAANTTVNHLGAGTVAKLTAGDTLVAKVLLGSAQFDSNDSWSVAFLG